MQDIQTSQYSICILLAVEDYLSPIVEDISMDRDVESKDAKRRDAENRNAKSKDAKIGDVENGDTKHEIVIKKEKISLTYYFSGFIYIIENLGPATLFNSVGIYIIHSITPSILPTILSIFCSRLVICSENLLVWL